MVVIVLCCFVLLPAAGTIFAATSVGVSPGRIQAEIRPGESAKGTVQVSNEGDRAIDLRSYPMDRRVQSGGNVVFDVPGDPRESVARWLSIEPVRFTLAPGEIREVEWQAEVPSDATPGDHVGVLFFETTPEARPGTVAIGSRVGAVISIRVPGKVVAEGQVASFRVSIPPFKFGLVLFGRRLFSFAWRPPLPFLERGPVVLRATVENTGNVKIPVTGEVTVKNMFGSTVTRLSTPEPMNVYPGDSDIIEFTWDDPPFIGRFVATGVFNLGESGQKSATAVFYTFPLRQAVAVILLTIGLWLLSRWWRRRTRRSGAERPAPAEAAGQAVPLEGLPSRKERKQKTRR